MPRIALELDYWSDDVATFDPEKVVMKLQRAFPEATVDPTDKSAAEVDRVRAFLDSQDDMSPDIKATMLRQIQGKARRNGPVYNFVVGGISGIAGRYYVSFHSDTEIEAPLKQRIVAFLESMRLGEIEVTK
jgi:hypothetical protein